MKIERINLSSIENLKGYTDPLSMNSTTDLTDYNCGGFALKTLDWENLESFDEQSDDIRKTLLDCEEEILKRCPRLRRTPNYKDIPNNIDVVGFRIAFSEELESEDTEPFYELEDFHFVLRTNGKWFHKPGSNEIREVTFDVDKEWPHSSVPYNSDIIWFKRA